MTVQPVLIDLSPIINQIVIPVLTPLILALASLAVTRILDALKVSRDSALRTRLISAVDNAIAYASNKAAAQGITISADQKVADAIAYLEPKLSDTIKKLKVGDHLEQLVMARLPQAPIAAVPPPSDAAAGPAPQ
jgi:hypothetical protein